MNSRARRKFEFRITSERQRSKHNRSDLEMVKRPNGGFKRTGSRASALHRTERPYRPSVRWIRFDSSRRERDARKRQDVWTDFSTVSTIHAHPTQARTCGTRSARNGGAGGGFRCSGVIET